MKVYVELGSNSFLLINLVLIDPHKRSIYDALGTEGLIQNDLQLVVRSKSPQEIREEYENWAYLSEVKQINIIHLNQLFVFLLSQYENND